MDIEAFTGDRVYLDAIKVVTLNELLDAQSEGQ